MADLTTLANVKGYLNITNSTDDTLLSRLITAASSFIEKILSRTFTAANYNEFYDGNDGATFLLPYYPVNSITSVTIDTQVIPLAPDSISNGYGSNVYGVFLRGYKFTKGYQNVQIAYNAGYSVIPLDIEDECIRLVALRYKYKDRIGVSGKGIGPEHVSYDMKDQADKVLSALRAYQKVVF